MTKVFTVTVKVSNCDNCPYAETNGNGNSICSESEGGEVTSMQQRQQNYKILTESCPNWEEAKNE